MKRFTAFLVGTAVAALLAVGSADAQFIGQVSQVNPGDLFQDIPNGVAGSTNVYAPASLLGNYAGTLPGVNAENFLIGGDATTNLFQRATTGASVTTTITYGGPDRWAYWSGTSTAMTVSRDTTAGDLPTGYKAAFKMARTSGQTGVVQMCMMQEVEGINSYALAGQTAEVDFWATPGANFSAASSQMKVYFISGTGADEGTTNAAFGLNAGGGGASAWTGQVSTAVTVSTPAQARYSAVAPIPANATEVAIALCYTPVGTAGTNDYLALAGIQLVRNSGLATVAGTTGAALNANDVRAKAFVYRSPALETELQQRYYYQVTEVTGPSAVAMCRSHSITVAECLVPFPVPMRANPTMSYANGFATETTAAGGTLGACTLATASTIAVVSNSATGIQVACTATTVPAAGTADVLYNNGGTGAIKASAEL